MRLQGWARRLTAGTGLALALAAPALANDSTAEIGAGGLMMVYNEAIELRSEDLYISADEVRVRYVFHNLTTEPRTYTIAFPLPVIDSMVYGEPNFVLPDPESANYVDFRVTVDGTDLTPDVFTRALALGVDRTDAIIAAGLPLNPTDYGAFGVALDGMSPETRRQLNGLGIFVDEEWGTLPAWRLETVFHWQQTFPAGQDIVVEHSYRPVVGYGFFGSFAYDDEWYQRYCMDDDFKAAATRMMGPGEFAYANEKRIEYILTTGANWAGPIGDFHVTVDKGSTNALVSLCAEGVTKTGATTFEWRETDFYPYEELEVLIISPLE